MGRQGQRFEQSLQGKCSTSAKSYWARPQKSMGSGLRRIAIATPRRDNAHVVDGMAKGINDFES